MHVGFCRAAVRWPSSDRCCPASLPAPKLGEHANLQLVTGTGMTQFFRASLHRAIQGLVIVSVRIGGRYYPVVSAFPFLLRHGLKILLGHAGPTKERSAVYISL